MADLPSFPANSRSPERNTLMVHFRLCRIIGNDFEVLSIDMATRGGSKEICVSQFAVNMFTSPAYEHETA